MESALFFLKIEPNTLRLDWSELIAPPKALPPEALSSAVVTATLSRKRQLLTTVSPLNA